MVFIFVLSAVLLRPNKGVSYFFEYTYIIVFRIKMQWVCFAHPIPPIHYKLSELVKPYTISENEKIIPTTQYMTGTTCYFLLFSHKNYIFCHFLYISRLFLLHFQGLFFHTKANNNKTRKNIKGKTYKANDD